MTSSAPGGPTPAAGLKLETHAFESRLRLHAAVSPKVSRMLPEAIEVGVRARWIVVEEDKPADLGKSRKLDRMRDARMPPADFGEIFMLRELRIVQENVDAMGEREP